VSTADQVDSGAGLAGQRAAIETEAERKGWVLITVLEDRGISAKAVKGGEDPTKGRPALAAAVALLEAGGADALVVAKLDRLSRSVVDFGRLLERAKATGWAIVLLDMQLDMTTPQGELMANMLVSFAQFERRLIGQRTKDGLAAKMAAGVKVGRPSGLSERVVERIRRERKAGRSLGAIADGLNEDAIPTGQGGKSWHASTVRSVLGRRLAPSAD
jgi:DNA invertase Pin-like site-specific DNA recombinase